MRAEHRRPRRGRICWRPGLSVFDRVGFEDATVAAIRARARASNGSFFHVFGSKKELAGALFLEVLRHYHAAVLAALDPMRGAGRRRPPDRAHLDWVTDNRREARFLFEISRSEWSEEVRGAQRAQNSHLAEGIERWRAPLLARGELLPMTASLFLSQIIGPAQIFCRAFLSGRDRTDPRQQSRALDRLRDPRAWSLARRSHKQTEKHAMKHECIDPDFAPIADTDTRQCRTPGIYESTSARSYPNWRAAAARLRSTRRPELLQQHGLFHGGVTAFLVDNATTIAAAASRGQPALTAEYKLNLLSPASGERLICRARVIKPGRQVAVVAADVFCVIDGVEKHTATALASIAMLDEKAARRIKSPA